MTSALRKRLPTDTAPVSRTMSEKPSVQTCDTIPQAAIIQATSTRPAWLWVLALSAALALHAALYVGVTTFREPPPPALDEIQLTLVARGDPVPENTIDQTQQTAAEPPAVVTPPMPVAEEPAPPPPDFSPPVTTAEPAPEPPSVDAAPPPEKPAEEAMALPVEMPAPPPPPVIPPDPPAKIVPPAVPMTKVPDDVPAPVIKSEDPPPPPPPVVKAEEPPPPKPHPDVKPAPRHLAPSPASQAHKVGTANGEAVETGQTRAAFAALVSAEIRSHQFYPDAARTKGISGHVVVSFTIGRAGTATSVTIAQSSGHGELDDAARQAVRAIHVPPPPGGTFSASAPFNFGFR